MGRRVSGFASRLLAGVCFFLFTICAQSGFAEATRTARIVFSDTDSWRSNLLITCESAECEVDTSNSGLGYPGRIVRLNYGESRVVENFASTLTRSASVGLTSLSILKGDARLSTHALFRDANHPLQFASVEIPELQGIAAQFAQPPATAEAWLEARLIQNDAKFSTKLALFSDGERRAYVTAVLYDERNQFRSATLLTVEPGFNFYSFTDQLRSGRLEIRYGGLGVGAPGTTDRPPIAGVAFVDWRAGGSPRVVPLRPLVALSIP